jgi:hypothetical protein
MSAAMAGIRIHPMGYSREIPMPNAKNGPRPKAQRGIVSTCPGRIRSPEILFARRSAERETPFLLAILERVSPLLTVYFTTVGLGFGFGFTTTGFGLGDDSSGRGCTTAIWAGCVIGWGGGSFFAMNGFCFGLEEGAGGLYHLSG